MSGTAISEQAIEQFRRQGYMPIGPVLTAEELAETREAYDRIFHGSEKPSSYRNLGQREGEAVSAGAVLQIIDMHRCDDAFRRLLHKPALLDWAAALMETPNVRLYHDQGLYKPALHGDIVPWHQDNGYWKLEPPGAASCWIALDDATLENGCMWVLPGSTHMQPFSSVASSNAIQQLAAPGGCSFQ